MTNNLFREAANPQEVLGSYGSVIRAPSRHGAYAFAAATVFAVGICFISLATYSRRERCEGQLLPEVGTGSVYARTAGAISQIRVRPDAFVHRGDILLVISGELETALGSSRSTIKEKLELESRYLSDQILQVQASTKRETERLFKQRESLLKESAMLDGEIRQSDRLTGERSRLLGQMIPLQAQGYVAVTQVQDVESQLAQSNIQTSSLHRNRLQVLQQIEDCVAAITKTQSDALSQVAQLRREMVRTQESIIENEASLGTVYRADRDGVVSEFSLEEGAHVNPGDHILSVRGPGEQMVARLYVPSAAIGLVKPSAPVSIRVSGYPFQKFGVIKGLVSTASSSPIGSAEVASQLGQQALDQRMYVVDVRLTSGELADARRRRMHLISGMHIDADLILEKRTLLEWVLEPLLGFVRERTAKRN